MPAPARIGRYELERPLARGGMAELFVARLVDDAGFARRVAIKRALPELDRDRAFAEMFRSEARLAASLAHHNIVAVHDLGEDSAGFFLVMELLHGADVGALLRAAPEAVPIPIVLAIASDACAGLHHAHERFGNDGAPLGIVHRDVSPQNLFVTFDGCTKLLDFGIAKAIDRIGDRATRTGTLRGKVPYMSPEQCRGEPLDRRSDVFSLGIVLWELVTGERLYGALGESDFEVFKQISERDAPDPTTKRADAPPALARVILRALARDREARYPTIAALHDELDAVGKPATAREVGAYVAARFADRAAAWRRGTLVDAPAEGPRVTAPLPVVDDAEETADFDVPSTRTTRHASTITRVPTVQPIAPRAWKLPVAVISAALVATLAYFAGRRREPAAMTPAVMTPAPAPAPAPFVPPVEDAQWFEPDDFIVGGERYTNMRLDNLRVAKQIRPEHFIDAIGHEFDTHAYWSTRVATASELAVGVLAFCHAQMNTPVGTTPLNRDDSRLGQWTLARITDVGELPIGVRVGDAACPVGAVRLPR